MRHSATRSLLERDDVIVVASVSCIYGIGDVETYSAMAFQLKKGDRTPQRQLLADLVALHYKRNDQNFVPGTFRARGDTIELFPSHFEDRAWRISLFGDEIEQISEFDPLTGQKMAELQQIKVYSNSHYVTPKPTLEQAVSRIKNDLRIRLAEFNAAGRLLEAQRLEQRTMFDIEMMMATGSCAGIENYSRYLTGRKPGEPPPTLFEYLPDNALVFVDESHVTIPQIGGMFRGDFNRKATLSEYGFRLPSCIDNRPLRFEEFEAIVPQIMFVSATPSAYELEHTSGEVAEQVIRPTGLLDPVVELRPTKGQVQDLITRCEERIARGERVLVTALTKRICEDLTTYMAEKGLRVRYLHSDIETLDRVEILSDLRLGNFDILVGVNLLREGLDLPEVSLVAILDADKEGFLRSPTSLIQLMGRAARNANGLVVMYADVMTPAMQNAIGETERRRVKQAKYNAENNITPQTIHKAIRRGLEVELRARKTARDIVSSNEPAYEMSELITTLEQEMLEAAGAMEFEKAATLRDSVQKLKKRRDAAVAGGGSTLAKRSEIDGAGSSKSSRGREASKGKPGAPGTRAGKRRKG
ncbi:MAG: excinuclease ABC subunit UvrB, partial [Planctomycetota bacterium]|nr:excinuclease ABC subunit UvrB [Planctomycetota bacterium]